MGYEFCSNLAGNYDCDNHILRELEKAGIKESFYGRTNNEVPYSYIGRLNGFVFKRAWNYWIVEGAMPLKTAEYLYKNYSGLGIRVAGDASNVEPIKYAEPLGFFKKVNVLMNKYKKHEITMEQVEMEIQRIKDNSKRLYVMSYHIDTIDGLKVFADTIKSKRIGRQVKNINI